MVCLRAGGFCTIGLFAQGIFGIHSDDIGDDAALFIEAAVQDRRRKAAAKRAELIRVRSARIEFEEKCKHDDFVAWCEQQAEDRKLKKEIQMAQHEADEISSMRSSFRSSERRRVQRLGSAAARQIKYNAFAEQLSTNNRLRATALNASEDTLHEDWSNARKRREARNRAQRFRELAAQRQVISARALAEQEALAKAYVNAVQVKDGSQRVARCQARVDDLLRNLNDADDNLALFTGLEIEVELPEQELVALHTAVEAMHRADPSITLALIPTALTGKLEQHAGKLVSSISIGGHKTDIVGIATLKTELQNARQAGGACIIRVQEIVKPDSESPENADAEGNSTPGA